MSFKDKFDKFADRATELAEQATERARDLASEHNDKIDQKLDRAAGYLDEKTNGRYADKIGTGVGRAKEGLDKFAERGEGGSGRADSDSEPPR